ncbi:MAG: hypothetical protein K2M16_08760 [Muribaculaceae bacterium]|nr:hypothetical protein [Muribaculaceae bacterium]
MANTKKESKKKTTPDFRDAQGVKPGEILLANDFDKGRSDISSFYVDRCIPLLTALADMIREKQLTLSPYSTTRMRAIFSTLKERDGIKKLKKQDLADLYSSFSADLLNVIAVAKADLRYENAWKSIVSELEVSSARLKAIVGRRPALEVSYGWYGDVLAPDVLFNPLLTVCYWKEYDSRYNQWYSGEFTISPVDRKTLADCVLGKEATEYHLLKSLPADIKLHIENFEGDISTDIITLEGLALNGSLLTASGVITAAKMKKVRQQTDIRGFRPDGKEWSLDRLELLGFAYFNLIEENSTSKENAGLARLARYAVEKVPTLLKGPNFGVFLPAYQGFTKTWTTDNYARQAADAVNTVIRQAHEDWLSLENFRMLLLCVPIGRSSLALRLFSSNSIGKSQLVRKVDKEHQADRKWKVQEIRWFDEVGFSFAVHWIRFLCAMGIIETAETPDISADDPLEGIRYVRLTSLGRYVFGFEKEYTPQATRDISGVEFDARNGIVTIDAGSPFQMFLGNIGKRISPTRFRISSETLMKGCKTKAELEQRIRNLQVIIDPEKEPVLRKIIDEAVGHTDCATREGGYSLLRLRPDLPGLRDAILSDRELREMTILAGHALALVKTHKMERFNAICASYGFLME